MAFGVFWLMNKLTCVEHSDIVMAFSYMTVTGGMVCVLVMYEQYPCYFQHNSSVIV